MLKSQVHDSRSRDILEKALALFAKIGYNQLNYREIAEHCGLNRTAIYHYFPNKRAVFAAALEQLFADLAADFRRNVEVHPELGEADKIEMVMRQAIELICRNPEMVRSIHEYLLSQVRQGENVARKVRRHTIVVRWTLIRLSRDAVKNGEFRAERPERIANILYGLLESAALQAGVYGDADAVRFMQNCRTAINAFKANPATIRP